HSPAGAPVMLSAQLAGEEIAIAVEDRGPGVAPEARERIFGKFFTTSPSGAGLGLAICRGVVTALGGSIALEAPEAARSGARFVIRLKVEPAMQEA
ncbi:MAG: sensor histidine kinase, partial [Rhodoblastus sp.]|nr:sensor histidine kinase [Rhodoblastus sp.]